jgi:hypothetical protein
MRRWSAIVVTLAAAGLAVPAAAQSKVYVPIAYTDEVFVLIQMPAEPPQVRGTARASQFAYYAAPSFDFEGVPVRLTETEFEIDCTNGTSRRLHASAYREIDDRVGNETYSEEWAPISAEGALGHMRRLACEGIRPEDAFYTNLNAAVRAYGKMRSDAE